MQTSAASTAPFTPIIRAAIDDLCQELNRRTKLGGLTAEYGATDCGKVHDVSLCIQASEDGGPFESFPLVTIMADMKNSGVFMVADSGCDPLAECFSMAHALNAARYEVMRTHRRSVEDALS